MTLLEKDLITYLGCTKKEAKKTVLLMVRDKQFKENTFKILVGKKKRN
jgi:hypothetical protein